MDTKSILGKIAAKADAEAAEKEKRRLAAREECTVLFDRVRNEICPKVAEYLKVEDALVKNGLYSWYAENNRKDSEDDELKIADFIYTDEYVENVGFYTRNRLRGIGIESYSGRNDHYYEIFVSPNEISLINNDYHGGYDDELRHIPFPRPDAGIKEFKEWSMYLQMLLDGFPIFEDAFQRRLKALGVA